MAYLPHRDLRHPWIKYQVEGYDEGKVVNRVHVLDFAGLTDGMRQTLVDSSVFFRHADGRKSEARLSGGHIIGRQAAHFRLVSDPGLRGLSVVASELPLINLHKLKRLNICLRVGDIWAWVASRPKRQQAAMAGAPGAVKDAHVANEGAQAVPTPVQAPQPPPPAPQHRTMSPRVERIEEEIRELRQSVVGFVCTYQAFDNTLIGSLRVSYQRRVRPRIGNVSTSTAPHTDDQPDP
nr:hypothetical protein [Tanacetum cinerariifolium]